VAVIFPGARDNQSRLDTETYSRITDTQGRSGHSEHLHITQTMSAMVVGEWALTTRPQLQLTGDILQQRDTGGSGHIVPHHTRPVQGLRTTMWATGRPWVELFFSEDEEERTAEENGRKQIRAALRYSLGTKTKWNSAGLKISCEGRSREVVKHEKQCRRKARGICDVETLREMPLKLIWLGDAQGRELRWTQYKLLYSTIANRTLRQIRTFAFVQDGTTVFYPVTHGVPMSSREAHYFREVCLCVVANYPELIGAHGDGKVLEVHHNGKDPHHVFEVGAEEVPTIILTWGARVDTVEWRRHEETVETAVERRLQGENVEVTS
jgi:hypothetical protein